MVVLAVIYVLDLVTRGLLTTLLIMVNDFVAMGQFWRLLTSVVLSGSLIGLLMNLLVLWIAGRAIESELGGWRFAALYVGAGLGGATIFFLLGPWGAAVITSGAAVVGLLAANAVGKLKTREDIRADIGLLVLLVLVLGTNGPGSMIGFDYARTENPAERLGSANGVVNVGGFTASLLTVLGIGLLLDATSPGGRYDLDAFRAAFAVQYVLWAVGLAGVLLLSLVV